MNTLSQTKKRVETLNATSIALQKGMAYVPLTEVIGGKGNMQLAMTVQAKLMRFGYMLGQDAFEYFLRVRPQYAELFINQACSYLKRATGGKFDYKSFYPNFPEEVMEMDICQLYMNAIRHYWSLGSWKPADIQSDRGYKVENIKYNELKLANETEFNNIFTSLVGINTSLMPQDLEIITWFVDNERPLIFPKQGVPFKENLCTLAGLQVNGLPVKTTTDVLRIAVHMSGGDISLPAVPAKKVKLNRWSSVKGANPEREKFKFKKFNRFERKYLLALLEQTNCRADEMVLKDQRWIRLGEILHPGEYKNKFPKAFSAFQDIRNDKVQSWYGKLQVAFDSSLTKGLAVLSERPGEFVRRIDWLVRTYTGHTSQIMSKFIEAADGASNKVLYELYTHFEGRDKAKDRNITVKGARKKTKLDNLKPLSKAIVSAVQEGILAALKAKFKKLPTLGKVYIDEELKKIPLPTNMRSLNFQLKPTIRGQRNPIGMENPKVIRAFCHWTDKAGTEDLDLSATFIGMGKASVISFQHLRDIFACHSGDIIGRPGNNAEYIDIDLKKSKAAGFKYVVTSVSNFRGRTLASVDAMYGMMEREHPESNKHWLPETVTSCQKLESTSSVTIISIIDLDTLEYIFLDVDSSGFPVATIDFARTLETIKQYAELPKLSVYDLLSWHANTRGTQIDNELKADTVFKFEDFSASYEKTGEYMGV